MHPDNHPPGSPPEDHFDNWLDAFVAGSSTPVAREPNPASPDFAAATSAARQVHELAQVAATARTSSTSTTSWEEILMSHTTTATAPTALASAPRPIGTNHRKRTHRMEAINRIVSIAAVLAIFIAGFATAWVARDRFGNEPNLLQLAASPTSTTTCTTRTLSQEEVDRIVAQYQSNPRPKLFDYMLTGTPVSEADALAAIEAYRAYFTCPDGNPGTDNMTWKRSVETQANLAERNLATSPAWMVNYLSAYRTNLESMSHTFTPLSPEEYIVDSNDPAIQPYLIAAPSQYPSMGTQAIIPSRFVSLSDGRIGVPVLKAIPGGARSYGDASTLAVSFITFVNVDGHWLIDDGTTLCPGECTTAEARLDAEIAKDRRLATVIGSPVASPVATPEASPKP